MAHKLTSKGQVTVPQKIRTHLGLSAGDAVEFRVGADGEVRLLSAAAPPAAPPKANRFAALRGRATVRMSTDELMRLLRGSRPEEGELAADEQP